MDLETRNNYGEILQQSAGDIRVVHSILESAKNACASETQRKMLALNASFLVNGGRVAEDEYRQILERCTKSGDFTVLAQTFLKHQRAQTEADLQAENLPATGDDFAPGRENLEGELRMIESDEQAVAKLAGRNPITNIGTPSLAQQPEWLLHCPDGWTLGDIFASVDTLPAAAPGDADIDAITNAAQLRMRNVA